MIHINGKLKKASKIYSYFKLPHVVRVEHLKDRLGLMTRDPGLERAIDEAVSWLCRAQDKSLSEDGGVALQYSLINGWCTSYPETTGYIISTLITYADLRKDEGIRGRVKKMLDWLVSIQFTSGGFQGGLIGCKPIVPVTFNTGQILLGLVCGVREFGEKYLVPMRRAADWLVETQDFDGCWRKYPSPLVAPGEKAYETHVAWGLLEAARLDSKKSYEEAALKNITWALSLQKENGWFEKCCLSNPTQPLTHTLGYVLRGLIEAYRYTGDQALLNASRKTGDGLLKALRKDGSVPGRLNQNWQGTVTWNCLTGSVQIAICWLLLYQNTGEVQYKNAAYLVNRFVRRTMKINGLPGIRGAIKGSFPIHGQYCPYGFPNWATKFFVDANMLEMNQQNDNCSYQESGLREIGITVLKRRSN